MRIMITGRHVEITPGLRRRVQTRLKKLERYGVKMGDIQVVLSVENYRHTAEAIVRVHGKVVQSKTSTSEMYASIDRLVSKVSRQVAKHKEKLVAHKARTVRTRGAQKPDEDEFGLPSITTTRIPLHALTVSEAIERLGTQAASLLVFMDVVSHRVQVVRRLDGEGVEVIDPHPVLPEGG